MGQQASSFSGPSIPSQYFVVISDVPLVQKGIITWLGNLSLVANLFYFIELTHKDLSVYVIPHLTEKWREMGLALALTPP